MYVYMIPMHGIDYLEYICRGKGAPTFYTVIFFLLFHMREKIEANKKTSHLYAREFEKMLVREARNSIDITSRFDFTYNTSLLLRETTK